MGNITFIAHTNPAKEIITIRAPLEKDISVSQWKEKYS